MKFHKQQYKHDPANGIYGDCQRAVIACFLDKELEEVPHFLELSKGNDAVFYTLLRNYLKTQGYVLINSLYEGDLENILECVGQLNPRVYYTLAGVSKNNTEHVVICLDNRIIHDTALDDSGIVGPCADGYYWVSFLGSIQSLA